MNQQINIHMTRKFFLAQCLGLLMLTAVLALLFWLVWLSLDPDWRLTEHRFRLREPSFVHLLEKVFEELPPWARATIVTFVPGYICWLFGSGVVSGLRRIFNREPFAVLHENGIRCWSAFARAALRGPKLRGLALCPPGGLVSPRTRLLELTEDTVPSLAADTCKHPAHVQYNGV